MDLNHPLLALGDDPPPFPPNQPQLQRLDRALLCQICKEPFVGPVSIACGHSFCSHCIRSSLDTLKKCPSCGEAASEGGIRRNRALEEMVDAWEEARPIMITLSKPAPPKRRAEAQTGGRVKRLRLSDGAGANGKSESGGEGSRSRSGSARPAIPSGVASASGSASPEKEDNTLGHNGIIELRSSDAEEEYNPEDGEEEEVEELSENDEGECPLCQARLPISSIPAHIERNCEPPKVRKGATGQVGTIGAGAGGVGSGNAKADWKKVFGGMGGVGKGAKGGKGTKEPFRCLQRGGREGKAQIPLKRLTKFNFSLSPPSALRDFLLLHSLPTTGDRPTLEARVSEWTLLYNSNLDTSHPRSLPALRAKLAEAEAARKRDKEKGKDALGEKLGTSGGMKEYARERRGEFERLREVARRGMKGKSGNLGQGEELEGEGKDGKGGSEGAAIVVD